MSMKTIYNCDHCGAECSGDEYATIGRWEQPEVLIFSKTIHGCSWEHLGFALAKLFGLPLDVDLAAKNTTLCAEIERQGGVICSQNNELARLQKLAADLQTALNTHEAAASITDPSKPTKPAIEGHEAYLEARMDYRRVAGGTAEEMNRFWQANRALFCHDERMVMANGDIVRDMEFEDK